MPTRKTITLTDKQDEWVQSQVADGEYVDDSEFLSHLVRCAQEKYETKLAALRKKIQQARDSGFSDCTFDEAWAKGEKEGLKILAEQEMTIHKTVALTGKQDKWIQSQVASGGYADESEYLSELVRREQEYQTKLAALRKAIQDGRDSGVSDMTMDEIRAEAVRRHEAKQRAAADPQR